MKFEKRQGILYRIRRRIDGLGETWKQIMVPKSLRICVMEVAHDSIFGGHLGVKKTKNRIQTNFYRPRMHNDVSEFSQSRANEDSRGPVPKFGKSNYFSKIDLSKGYWQIPVAEEDGFCHS